MKSILMTVLLALPAAAEEPPFASLYGRAVGALKAIGVAANRRNTTPELSEGRPVASAVRPEEVRQALERGSRFLLERQREDGAWTVDFKDTGSADNEYVRAAITAYAVEALKLAPSEASERAIERGERYIDEHGGTDEPARRRGFPGQTQKLYALAMGLTNAVRREPSKERDALAGRYVSEIQGVVGAEGGADYYPNGYSMGRPASFQMAMLAEALREAGDAGVPVPEGLLKGIYESIESARDEKSGAFSYKVGQPDGEARGGASRSLACDVALSRGERVGKRRLVEGLKRFQGERGMIAEVVDGARFAADPKSFGERQMDHHDPARGNVAPYYYLFGMYWASEALSDLPSPRAVPFAHGLGRSLVDTQRADGAWLDSYTYGGPAYGTASAMLTLANVVEALKREGPPGR